MMKGNDGSGNIPARDEWRTPQDLYKKLCHQYGFEFDCCASEENTLCGMWSTNFESVRIVDVVSWMNPPFSKAKEMFEHFFKVVKKGVCIYRCDNIETRLWQEVILKNADWILIVAGRLNYEGMDGVGCRFPSALIGIGLPVPKGIDGRVWIFNKKSLEDEE